MLKALRTEEFKLGEKKYRFDDNGDINLGYDIIMWRSEGRDHVHDVVAEYNPLFNNITYMDQQAPGTRHLLEELEVGPHSHTVTLSRC